MIAAGIELATRALGSKYALGALIVIAAGIAVWTYGNTRWRAGYEAYRLEMEQEAAAAERDRVKDDARLKDLSVHDLCADYLRARGMPVEACDELRRLSPERLEPDRDGRFGESRPARP